MAQKFYRPGKISTQENENCSGPEKCWKFLNVLIIFHFRIFVGLNIPGIFPQYSTFEYFLLFTVDTFVSHALNNPCTS